MAGIKDKTNGIKTRLRNFRHEIGKEILERVKRRTPVETGTLQAGWTYQLKDLDVSVRNEVPYASYVEYGTEKMAPRAMLRTTIAEIDQIAKLASDRAGVKK